MSAAATAVESTTTTVETAAAHRAAMEATTRRRATMEPTSRCTTMKSAGRSRRVESAASITAASIANSTVVRYATAVSISRPSPISTAVSAPVATATPVAAIPGTGADEHATDEPARSVVPVRRASVRIVRVIAIGTNRSDARIAIPIITVTPVSHSNPNGDLGLGWLGDERGGNHHSAQQQEIP